MRSILLWLNLAILPVAFFCIVRHAAVEPFSEDRVWQDAYQDLAGADNARVSKDRYLHFGTAVEFDTYDVNHDGFWDLDEFKTAVSTEDENRMRPRVLQHMQSDHDLEK